MKVAQKIQRIRIRGLFTCQMPLTSWTWNIPPPVIYLIQVRNRENIPGWIPPSPISCSHTLGHTRHNILPRYALWCFDWSVTYYAPSPLLLSSRPQDRCCPCDRLRRRRPLLARATRQAPPLIIPISPIPFSHACIRFLLLLLFAPILMHSLLL